MMISKKKIATGFGIVGLCLVATQNINETPLKEKNNSLVKDLSSSHNCEIKDSENPNLNIGECQSFPNSPPGMVRIEDYYIDRFESSVIYEKNGIDTPWSPYHHPDASLDNMRSVSIMGAVPQGYIDGFTAEKLCKNSGKRLCTSKEWIRACRGRNNFIFPYGNSLIHEACNGSRALHPAIEIFGPSNSSYSKIQSACINQLYDTVDRSGFNSLCTTEDSVYDMVGNLHEWVSDTSGVFRGGYYVDTYRNGQGCLYATTAHSRHHWDYSTGFRCCKDL